MFTHRTMPNQITAASGGAPGGSSGCSTLSATGASSGTMMKAISKKSRKKARKKTNRLTTIRKPSGPPGRSLSMCSTQTLPSTPWKTSEKTVEPIRMNITIADRRIVDSIAWRTSVQRQAAMQRREDDRADRAERAGLGRRRDAHEDRAEDQEDQHDRRHHAPQHLAPELPAVHGARLRRQGRHRLRHQDRQRGGVGHEDADLQHRRPDRARYMSPTERPSWSARMTSTSDGGISCVIVPEAAMTPVA